MVRVTAKGRSFRGTYSEASAAAFGIAPPSPSPAKDSKDAKIVNPLTAAIARVGGRRRVRSRAARCAGRSDPRDAAGRAANDHPERTEREHRRKGARGSDHSFINAGMTLPMSWLSIPSRMIASAVPEINSV